jgi:hypothetical protein
MDTWMVACPTLKIDRANSQIPSFGKFEVYSARYGPLEKWIKEQ